MLEPMNTAIRSNLRLERHTYEVKANAIGGRGDFPDFEGDLHTRPTL